MPRFKLSIVVNIGVLILSTAAFLDAGVTTAFQFSKNTHNAIFLTSQSSVDSKLAEMEGVSPSGASFACSAHVHLVQNPSHFQGGMRKSLGFVEDMETCAASCCRQEEVEEDGCNAALFCHQSQQCITVSCKKDQPCSLIPYASFEADDVQVDELCQTLLLLPQDSASHHTPRARLKSIRSKRSAGVSSESRGTVSTNHADLTRRQDTNLDQSQDSSHLADGAHNSPLDNLASFGGPSASVRSDSTGKYMSSNSSPSHTKSSDAPTNRKKKPDTVELTSHDEKTAPSNTHASEQASSRSEVRESPGSTKALASAPGFVPHVCELGIPDCPTNEICEGYGGRRRDGLCRCIDGYKRSPTTGACESTDGQITDAVSTGGGSGAANESGVINGSSGASGSDDVSDGVAAASVESSGASFESGSMSMAGNMTAEHNTTRVLEVGVTNKTVKLSAGKTVYDDQVTLSAYVVGDCPGCQYEWSLIQRPDTSSDSAGSLTEPHSQTATLANLVAGTYLFSVKVTQPGDADPSGVSHPAAVGSTVANLTVLKAPQSNRPPTATIVPPRQKVTLPTTAVILDGSGSSDDNTESSKLDFRWEIITGPLGFSLKEKVGQTLTLVNLFPGNYTIMLKVKDAEGLEGNTTAVVEVVQEKDYPPSANAGGDQIIYLPQTETLVNGSASSDDHGIVEWEWTKGRDDDGLAVDMQDTRTPILKLSGLEEGHYQFVLKVVDGSEQSDSSVVNVYVHTPDVTALVADAGPDIKVSLPVGNVTLDGSNSKGVLQTTNITWSQVSGPSVAKFVPYSAEDRLRVNATGLTRGVYVFQLQLATEDKSRATTDTTTVTVKQEQNLHPKANGGGDFSVTLPVSLVQVNGSSSTDDVGIVKWRWERLPRSLAAGQVLGQSASAPVLMLTGLVEGQYQWKLTVWDDQGASDSDTVSFIVKSGPHLKDLVAVVLGVGIESVSAAQLSSLLQALKMVLRSGYTLQLIDFSGVPYSGECSAVVLGYDSGSGTGTDAAPASTGGGGGGASPYLGEVVEGVRLAAMLQSGVKAATASAAADVFEVSILAIHTVVCQNNCSGRGECDQARRECVCRSWWMESFWRRRFGDGIPNCDWSIIYVFVSSVVIGSLVVILLWVVVTLLVRRSRRGGGDPRRRGKRWGCFGGDSTSSGGSHRRRGGANGTSRYTLLDEEGFKMRSTRGALLDSSSDSGSDAEVHFDQTRSRGRHKAGGARKNGLLKPPGGRLRT